LQTIDHGGEGPFFRECTTGERKNCIDIAQECEVWLAHQSDAPLARIGNLNQMHH
jgi:hypothetical protein